MMPSSCGPKVGNKGVLSQASERERQGVEDVEQLCDKGSEDNRKKTMSASQHLDKNNQCLMMIQKLKKKYRAVFSAALPSAATLM